MDLVAGIDSSTTATKVEVRELASGRIVGHGSAPHPSTHPPRSEQDPAAWWAAFESAWQQAGAPQVSAISVAGQQHGMVALDEQRRVIRPAKLWNDTESAPDAAWLVGQLPGGRAAWADACGLVPVASFTITKLSWMHRCEPDAWLRLAHVVLPHDWITFQLTGRLTTDRGDASGTGYWSAATGAYRDDLLAVVDDRDWSTVVPAGARPRRGRRGVARCAGRSGHRRQHGRRAGRRAATGRRRRVDRDLRHGVRRERHADRRCVRDRRRVRRRHRTAPPARLHAQRHQGDRRRRSAARCGPRRPRRARARRPTRRRRPHPAPVPGRRADPGPADGDRRAGGDPQRRHARAARQGRGRRRRVRAARRSRRPGRAGARRRAPGARRRRRALPRVPSGARRPVRPGGARPPRRPAGRHRRLRASGGGGDGRRARRHRRSVGARSGRRRRTGPRGAAAAADVRAAYAAVRDASAPT